MRNWDLTDLGVRVNWPSLIWQVPVLIQRVITPIQGLLNPIRQVKILIALSSSYSAYHYHLHPPSLSFTSTTLPSLQKHQDMSSLSISPCNLHELTLSTAYAKCSIHRVQHTSSTAYTEYSIHWGQRAPKMICRPCIPTISSLPLNVASASIIPPYRSTSTSQFSIGASTVKSPHHIATVSSKLTEE